MSNLELNKIAASILIAALVAMIVGIVANILYKPKLNLAHRGYKIEVPEHSAESSGGAAQSQDQGPDIEALMAKATAEAGQNLAKKCISCHSFEKNGAHKVGPNLASIVNNDIASKTGFSYSKAMSSKGGKWDRESLFAFLHKPGKFIPGTKMSFAGLSKFEDIANIIAYLEASE